MESCKNCCFYCLEYDLVRQIHDDMIFEKEEFDEKHYCVMYDESIDSDIYSGIKICKYYYRKDGS